jgi:hypothetical protein
MREPLCFSCFYAKIEVIDTLTHELYPKHCKQLSVYCRKSFLNKVKFVKECSDYRPKQGKINKKLYQMGLFEGQQTL